MLMPVSCMMRCSPTSDERKGDFSYKISVSMLEIYNETINDLLDKDKDKAMKIHRGMVLALALHCV